MIRLGDSAPRPPRALADVEIVANRRTESPTATILCVTFQAAAFIEDTLNSLLAQQSPYPFEVVVRDDGSTDGTQEILTHYAQMYPETLSILLEPHNTYKSLRPFSALANRPLGDFVLLCEGDDYWLDDRKLAKQVAALLEHPNVVASFHDSIVIEDQVVVSVSRLLGKGRNYSASELLSGARMTADTLCFRNVGIPISPHELRFDGWIKVIRTLLGEHGGAIFQADILPSVYRIHDNGITSRLNRVEGPISSATSNYWMAVTLAERGHRDAAARHLKRAANQILTALESMGVEDKKKPFADCARWMRRNS